jgi:hypothetical protein
MKQRNGQNVGSIDANHSSNFSLEKVNISDPEMLQRMRLDWNHCYSLSLYSSLPLTSIFRLN